MLIKYTFGSKSQTVRMRYSFQSTSYRQTDFTPKWVVVLRLHDTVPRFRTGVKFSPRCENRGDSRRHNILWWYHVNKYRAMRGNRSELAPGRKTPLRTTTVYVLESQYKLLALSLKCFTLLRFLSRPDFHRSLESGYIPAVKVTVKLLSFLSFSFIFVSLD